jgi:hypothetical protein
MVVVLIMTALAASVHAADETDKRGGWEFIFVPYLWALSLDGDITVEGRDSKVSISFIDILKDLQIAFMGEIFVRKDRFGLFVNPIFGRLKDTETFDGVDIDTTMDLLIMSFGLDYRLGPYPLGNTPGGRTPAVTIEPYVGGRYTYLDTEIEVAGFGDASGSVGWVDPIVGLRTIWDLTGRWNVTLSGNIGGFGVSSDFAWEAAGLIGYRFGLLGKDKNANFVFGYRALYEDYEKGSGGDRFEFDATIHGPVFGLSIRF